MPSPVDHPQDNWIAAGIVLLLTMAIVQLWQGQTKPPTPKPAGVAEPCRAQETQTR